jgi:hypothetical protein
MKQMQNASKIMVRCTVLFLLTGLLTSCSLTKVINSWKADDASEIKSKNVLVIARTNNAKARKAFEDATLRQLKANKIKGDVSYHFIEELNPNKKLTQAEIEAAKKAIQEKGFNAVVMTVVKDRKSTVLITKEGGYYAGATYSSELNPFLYDFYAYYANPYSAPSARFSGNYVEETFTEQESVTYVLETLIFNLDKPNKEQLMAQVTASLEDPGSAIEVADGYARTIAKTLKK